MVSCKRQKRRQPPEESAPLCSFSGPSLPFDEEEGDYGDDFDKKQKYVPIQHIQKNGQGHKIHMR